MLLIEYRVCLPVSVEEYQVAQLYMIMKKSQKESESAGSRVEIMCNEPYEDGPGGTTGQYTRKHYHIGERLPKWATSIITKPVLEEEAWNAYPYTKTKYTCHQAPAMIKDSFSLSIETKYLNDIGNSENVFNLSASELRQRRVYHLDMINDYKDVYVEEEDPLKFVSEKTGRGPLGKNWVKERDGQKEILCAYKLCRIRFDNYFFGQKVENDLIHERALKKLLIHAHRQAWCWQDEYYGLKMEDMRKLEAEAAEDLNKRFANIDANGNIKESTTERSHPEGSEANKIAANNPEKNGTSSAVDAQSRRRKNGKLDSVSSDASNGRLTHEKVPSENGDGFGSTNGQSNDSVVNYISPTSLVKEQLTRSAEASPNQRHSAEPVSRQSTNLIDATEQGGCEVERDSSATESFADLESEGEDEGDKDDEFFDALSQQLCNSTLILDCEPDGTEATGQSQEGSFALDKSHEESFLSTEPIGKNVLILLSADSLFKYDKTSFSDYEQFFRENIFKILQRFFHSQPQSTIVKSFSLPLGLICDLQTQMSQVSEKNIGHARYRSRDIFDSEPLEFGSHTVAMSTAALFMPKQPSYSQSVEEVSTDIERYIKNLKSEIGDYVDFEVSVICDNLASVLFHDILTGFSPASKVNQKMPNISVCDAFPISNVYYLGSSLGFVLSFYGRGNQSRLTFPLYNLFFAEDSCSARLEPILIGQNEQLTDDSRDLPFKLTSYQDLFKRGSERHRKLDVFPDIQGRSDLQLWSGEGEDEEFIELVTRVRGTHALYWESFDVAFFILSNFTSHSVYTHNHYTNDNTVQQESHGLMSDSVGMEGRDTAEFSILNDFFTDADSRERERERATADMSALQRRKFDHNLDEMADSDAEGSSARKAKSFPPMHVLNDMAITVGNEAMIIGRFGYRVGVFVSKLSRETIELDFRNEVGDEANSDWSKIGQIHTGSKGRVMFNFTRSAELKQGLYSVRALCPGDLSRAKATLCVLPPRGVQAVLFSIDGTFADSVSLTGSNSKLRSSSVELVRFWSALGYLVVYASARPNIMKERVKSWLDAHGFPPSICLFVEGLSTPEKNMTKKANLLKQLKENLDLTYFAAYGSQKDLAMYLKLGITQERLFIFPDRLAASPRSKNVAQSLANCEIISKNGIPAHVANLRLKSKQLTSKSPLHFAIQSSRKSATDFPRAKTSSLTVTGSNNEFVCISEDSCNLPEVSMPTAPNSKSPRLREKLLGTIQSITKRDTQLSLTESRQSKHDLKQP